VVQDAATAVAWYQKAAEQGFAAAQFNLGHVHYNDKGVVQDAATAAAWFLEGCRAGLLKRTVHSCFDA
jgi:TPR repeat protein